MEELDIHFVRDAVLEKNPAAEDHGIQETPEGTQWTVDPCPGIRMYLTIIEFDDGTPGYQLDEVWNDGSQTTTYLGNDIIAVTTLSRIGRQ